MGDVEEADKNEERPLLNEESLILDYGREPIFNFKEESREEGKRINPFAII